MRTTDGSLTAVGSPDGQNFYDFGATPAGLYGVSTDGKLYGASPLDGHITLVGSLGISLPLRVESSSSNLPTLYFINGSDLYTLSTATGAASFVGTAGGTIGAMTMAGGTLFGGDSGTPKSIVTINTTTGVGAVTHSVSGGSFGNYLGMASVSAVPEPGTWLLFAAGTAALLVGRRVLSLNACAVLGPFWRSATGRVVRWPASQPVTRAARRVQVMATCLPTDVYRRLLGR